MAKPTIEITDIKKGKIKLEAKDAMAFLGVVANVDGSRMEIDNVVAAPNIDNASPGKQYAYFIEMYAMMISALIRSASQGERFTAQELLDKVAERIFQGVMYDARRVS